MRFGVEFMESITSRKNTDVRMMRSLMKSAEYRRETDMFAVEGDHLCGELAERSRIECFLYTEKAAEKYPETVRKALSRSLEASIITDELSEYISDTKTPQGMFAAAERFGSPIPKDARRFVVLDGVQDPGNVGTIIRAAEAFGIDAVLYSSTCADVFTPKTLRASMGSVFRVPKQFYTDSENLRGWLNGFTVFGAMLDNTAKRLGEINFPEKTAIVIGSEGRGISPEIAAVCDEKIYIPINGAESLNAAIAAAVIMWEMRRAR